MEEFDKVIGFKFLRGLHMNDSKGTIASFRSFNGIWKFLAQNVVFAAFFAVLLIIC